MRKSGLRAALLAACICLVLSVLPVRAQAAILVDSDNATLDFPTNIHFALTAHGVAAIDQVQLIYRTNARSCLSSSARMDMDFQKGSAISVDWNWDLLRSANLPPGAVITWQWQIQDTAGNTLTTPEKSLQVEDASFPWQRVQAGGISVYWNAGGAAFGQMILSTAASSLARLAKEAAIARPDAVRLMIYPSNADLKAAVLHVPDWIGGIAFPEYGTVMIGIAPGDEEWAATVVPHELAHMVVGQRIDNCLGNELPTWLNEGLATFAEGATSSANKSMVENAVKTGQAETLLALSAGFPADSGRANLAYAQSGMVASYLIETYGSASLDQLLGKVKQGLLIDSALSEVYHLDTAGIDKAWRASLGYGSMPPTIAAKTTQPTPKRSAVPTLALYTAAPQAGTATPAPSAIPSPSPTLPSPTVQPSNPTALVTETLLKLTPLAGGPSAADAPIWPWLLAGAGVCLAAAIFGIRLLRKH